MLTGLALLMLSLSVNSQDQEIADSLKRIYSRSDASDTSTYELLATIAFNESDPDQAEKYAEILIKKARSTNNLIYQHKGHFQKGNAKRLKGDYDKAFKNYFRSLELAKESGFISGVGNSYTVIADTYSLIEDSENAMVYYNKAIYTLRMIQDSTGLATALLNAGDEYFNTGKYDSALLYFQESGEIFDLLDYSIGQAYNLGNVGLVYAQLGNHGLAEESLLEASKILEELGDFYPIAVYHYYLADIYLSKNELSRAIRFARFGYEIGKSYGLKEQIKDGAGTLSLLYERAGNATEALKFLKEYNVMKDSIGSITVVQQMADLRRAYEVSQKQIEVDLLNEQKRNQQIIGVSLVVILFLIVLLLVILYQDYKRKKQLNSQLTLLNQTKDKLFSIISHDLRGPISAFSGLNRIIKMHIRKKQHDKLESMTGQIDKSVTSISLLLDNLLNWAAQQQENFPHHPESTLTNDLINHVIEILQPSANEKLINIQTEFSGSTEIWVDRNSTMTILRNLINNAIKFTPEGGSITIKAREEGNDVAIQISDSGIGMNEEKIQNLFHFGRHKSTYGTSGEKGLGLGLQLVYEFVQLNGGNIEVQSKLNEGTQFELRFPQTTMEEAAMKQ